ncbi:MULTISPECIES: hypothetical protein [Klebsiella pneumoniae complex]|nr:hypothetical protein [Klebsiella variicola]KAA0474869.1 hypothetical protein F0331_01025 [Klebsiella variicola]HBQ5120438.1 hypothetical protein [Klebsiella variicola]HCI9591142.1 hypothetical protein [Klebsiella variicola]HEK5019255.1 hypothetical protein [Klebsiella variicola]
MMKKKVKEILNKLQPSHIAWLLAGVLLAEGFNWLLYKDIKRVTAPGLSSLVAVCALVLAIYSAFQVKKWMDNKVNEKGFKKCEEIIDQLGDMQVELTYANLKITKTLEQHKTKKILQQEYKKEVDKSYNETNKEIEKNINIILKTYSLQKQLYVWNFEMRSNFDTWDILENILRYSDSLDECYKSIVNQDYKNECDIKSLNESFTTLMKSIKMFHTNRFKDIFITSHAKKVE